MKVTPRKVLLAAIILILAGVVGYQVGVRLMIGYKIQHSHFLAWCQTLSSSDVEFITFSDPSNRELFSENYVLSEEEEARLVGILNDLDTEDLNIVDTTFRTNPVFTICIAVEEGKLLLQHQSEGEDLFRFTPPIEDFDDHFVGLQSAGGDQPGADGLCHGGRCQIGRRIGRSPWDKTK